MTKELRDKIYNSLTESTLNLLETGQITVKDSKKAAEFILGLDAIDTLPGVLPFLEGLGNKLPNYQLEAERLCIFMYQVFGKLGPIEFRRQQDRKALGEEKWRWKTAAIRMVTKDHESISQVSRQLHISQDELAQWVKDDEIRRSIEQAILRGEDLSPS